MAIYPKLGHKLLYTYDRWNEMPYVIPLPCAFHSISSIIDATHAPTRLTMILSTSYHHMIILVHRSWLHFLFHCCLCPSVLNLAQASPPHSLLLQSLHIALHACNRSIKPSHVLIFSTFDHMTQCHVSCAMSSFIITCVSFVTFPSHFHLHGICFSHTCIYELITCVSHINTISLHRLSLNYQNHTRTFHLEASSSCIPLPKFWCKHDVFVWFTQLLQ